MIMKQALHHLALASGSADAHACAQRAVCDAGPMLALGRAHELAGPARRVLAAMAAGRLAGPVIWISGPWVQGAPHPEGLARFFDPRRLVLAHCRYGIDALWAAEEALRSGAAPLVVLEAAEPPALTPACRLNLAAEAGGAAGESAVLRDAGSVAAPLCLILTPEGGAAAAVQTRWRIEPLPGWAAQRGDDGAPRWRLALLRDKAGAPATWEVSAPPRHAPRRAGAAQFRRAA